MSTRSRQRRRQAEQTRNRERLRRPDPPPPAPPRPSAIFKLRSTHYGLLALFLISFAIYFTTCARHVTGEDSGELITAAATCGVAHPPGYPLWCLLAKVATLLPLGEVAFRVALLSAFLGALTVTTLAAGVLLLTRIWAAAIAASLTFGLLRDQWSQSVIAEVYTLNSFFLAACFLLLLLWRERKSPKLLALFAFTFGLSLTNHHTMLAAAPGFLVYLVAHGWRQLIRWRVVLLALGCFVVGLLPYAYLPIAASQGPDVNWGDPSTWDGFLAHVTRQQYASSEALAEQTWNRFGSQLGVLWDHFNSQGGTIFLLLGLGSVVLMILRGPRSLGLCLGLLLGFSTLGIIRFTNFDLDWENTYANRLFFVPGYLALAIAAGWGVGAVLQRLPRRSGLALGAAMAIAFPLAAGLANRKTCDYSGYDLVDRYSRALLRSVSHEAILFPSSDHNSFPLLYLHYVEGLRPDVTIADKYGYVDPPLYARGPFDPVKPGDPPRSPGFRQAVITWLLTEDPFRPLYFTQKAGLPGLPDHQMLSEGLWYRTVHRSETPDQLALMNRLAWEVIASQEVPTEDVEPLDYTAKVALSSYAFADARSLHYQGRTEEGRAAAFRAADLVPGSREVQNNLGSLLAEHRCFADAETLFRRALALDGSYLTARRNLATALRASGQLDLAWALLEEMWHEDPFDAQVNQGLAEIARERKEWSKAAFYLESLGHLRRDYAAYRDAGLIRLLELKEPREAKELLRASLALNADQPEIRDVESRIKRREKREGITKADDEKDPRRAFEQRMQEVRQGAGLPKGVSQRPAAPDPLGAVMPKLPELGAKGVPSVPAKGAGAPPTPQKGGPR